MVYKTHIFNHLDTLTHDDMNNIIAGIDENKSNKQEKLVSGSNIKTINGQSVLGSGNISVGDSGSCLVDTNGFSIYGTRMIANPLETLNGLTVACMGDSITQGTSLGDPTTEKATDANGQKYPAITDEELATTTPAGSRGKSYVYYLAELGLGIKTTNLGTTGWTLSTGTAAPSKISGSSLEKWATGVPTCLELPSNFIYGTDGSATDLSTKFTSTASYPKVFTLMMGVNDFSKEAPLGEESSLYKDGALDKILTYELRYIYTDINGNIVDNKANPISNPKSYIDDENKIIYCFTNEVWGAWEYAALKLIKFFSGTDTKIYFMTPPLYRGFLYEGVGPDNTNHQGYYFGEVIDVIIKTAYKYKIPVLDNYHMCGITPENAEYYLGDKVHPNFRGHILLANRIAEFLKLNPTIMSNSLLTPQSGRWTGW